MSNNWNHSSNDNCCRADYSPRSSWPCDKRHSKEQRTDRQNDWQNHRHDRQEDRWEHQNHRHNDCMNRCDNSRSWR